MLYLGVSETHDAQLKIIEALTRKFRLQPDLNLRGIAELCPLNFTGADFYALCSDAMLNAMSRTAQRVDEQLGKLQFAELWTLSDVSSQQNSMRIPKKITIHIPSLPSIILQKWLLRT